MTLRKIQQVVPGLPASDGAGVKLIRSLGERQIFLVARTRS